MTGEPPKVTGLSPVEGPPGTKVTIRGENLGIDQNDLVNVTICGVDCSMYSEWKSSSKIVTRTRVCTGRGEVLVTTRSGGVGTCTVHFRGILEVIGPTVESAIWVDESHMFSDAFGHKHPTSPAQLHPEDPLGISDESVRRFPEEELRQLFPEGSGNLLSENFNPTWYLLENYNSTSFSDLKAGLMSLKRKVGQLQEGPSSFLKSNVNAIVICLDVLHVFQDVEQRVQWFRNALMDSLKQLPMPVEEQKRLIRYLISLEVPGSPAWDAVRHNYNWLLNSVETCKQKHLSVLAKGDEDERKRSEESHPDLPRQVLFVEEVTTLFQKHLCDFWKLGLSYFAGDFLVEDASVNDRERDEKELREMVASLVGQLSWEVRVALLPPTHHSLAKQAHRVSAWPGHKTNENLKGLHPKTHCYCFRQCYLSLLKLDIPEENTSLVQQLIFDLRVHSMTCLFGQAAEDVRNLLKSEVWRLEKDDRCGGTTQLPLMFENRVVETLQLVRENILQSGPREMEVFEQINVQGTIKQYAQAVLQAFVETLEKCALSPDRLSPIIDAIGSNVEILPPGQRAKSFKQKREDSLTTPPLEKRLLIVLSNCSFTSRVVIPRLQESFERHGYPDMSLVIQTTLSRLAELDRKLFQKLLEAKCDPIVGAIEPNMYAGAFDWKKCAEPMGVSSYIKEALMSMIEVHAEVYTISPPLVSRIMTPLAQNVAEEISRLYECTEKFTKHGNMQATLDLRALEEAVDSYRTQNTGYELAWAANFSSACYFSTKDKELVDELLKRFRSQMRLQLLCFKEDVVVSV
ncbi:hypothetical protein HPB47_008146 [Ixodes persulcatus]|uniref:Uncharacterized protein n=1 Tax=Ixodes persulcatus TaxID=34615 RepID=A0AC60P5H4_IXOPE|nr:hypothetical protein HPB47_008146 [Ixodes persulcatus]